MQVTKENIGRACQLIEAKLGTCSFLAVDLEFGGIKRDDMPVSIFDDLPARIAKVGALAGIHFQMQPRCSDCIALRTRNLTSTPSLDKNA